jgi:hypothetical protein
MGVPWPGEQVYVHFAALGLLAAMVPWACCIACHRRAVFPLAYVFLLEQASYLNQYYLLLSVELTTFACGARVFNPAIRRGDCVPVVPAGRWRCERNPS